MVPPLTGVAVKVTLLPLQIAVWLAAIVTAGVTSGVTVTVTLLLVAVAGDAHAADDCSTQLTVVPAAMLGIV